jgi:transcriptional regulator with XRE-family HTH domain
VTHRDTSSIPSRSHDTPLQRFGATLRQYRKQRRLSQQALAARTGIRRAYISDIELGKRNISVLTLLPLAQVLRIPSAWLLVGLDAHTALPPPGTCAPGSSSAVQEAGGSPDAPPTLQRDLQAILLARLGAAIRQYRQQRGLFQAALATLTDLTPTYIGEIERGKRNVSVLRLLRIADALGLSVAHLLAALEPCQPSVPALTP